MIMVTKRLTQCDETFSCWQTRKRFVGNSERRSATSVGYINYSQVGVTMPDMNNKTAKVILLKM